jgi:hypothetical protein
MNEISRILSTKAQEIKTDMNLLAAEQILFDNMR